ncbi:MAG TPA: hypothetical protein VFU63_07955 [Ktedonobacterales bacterium]|nr:hypothetical protein [Ktedonobacterales bacterium]
MPIAKPAIEGIFPLCATCAREAPRCNGCSQPITSTWYTFEELLPVATPRKFCPRCVQGRPRCDLCRAPVAEGAQPLADGQYRCALCLSQIVRDDGIVRAVYDDAVAQLTQVLGGQLDTVPQLQVVSRRKMGEIRRRYEHHSSEPAGAASHHVLGYFVQVHGLSSVYVEAFLPRELLLGTLAHELAHAWQTEQSLHLKDAMLREGFAEWVAYRVLVARGLPLLAERATRRDDIYGRGLRHFLNIENRFGYAGVVKRAKGLPA